MSDDVPKKPFLFGIYATKPHLKWAIGAIICVFIATAIDRYTVVVIRNFTDSLTNQPLIFSEIWKWAIAYPVLLLIASVFWRGGGFTGMRWFMNFRFSAYQALYSYLTLHSKEYFNSRFAGALANKIGNAVDGTESVFENLLWRFIPLIIGMFWYVFYAWTSSPILGAIILIWSLIFLGVNVYFAKKIEVLSFEFAQSLSSLKGSIVDSISNISLVHEYAHIAGEREYIKKFVKNQRDKGLAEWQLSEWVLVSNNIMIFIFMILMIGTSVYLFQTGLISIGVIVMVVAIVGELAGQFIFIGMEIKNTTKFYGEAREGLKEILHEHTIVDSPGVVDVTLSEGDISIESIDFEYENAKVFQNFSLEIPAGQKVGIVGRSGAGKTTFVSLLLRHFEVQKGQILIDGQDIQKITLDSLRRAIAFVPQDTSLFHRTIKENIRYSNPKASDLKVKRAAKLALADKFIEDLPQGFDTLVGERGVKLSGGQRQRIAIARAFLKDAPILILDEATSSLDSESEHAIQISLEALMKERTVIAIAHRLSTLKKMDRIVVIENGKILEDGDPSELMKKENGVFKAMWDHQVEGFIVDE
ncbi:hypothetical protein A3A45_00470 [Candidatus Daviesbacteria bacterium RIFCSPLOWO2_01_FULL_36_8]|nr:MAG: hypothetical protein A3A45_00470 [Candidatus Daviesbacteria bacterium RIFCSPLOWO2_01_FULL_36_8]